MDPLKEAFQRIKEDMLFLRNEISELKKELEIMQKTVRSSGILFKTDSTHSPTNPTDSTHSSTDNSLFKPLKAQKLPFSIGNRGVPTDRQTDRQTDKQTESLGINKAAEVLESLDNMKKEIRIKFKQLTEQEILVFSMIYQLDEEEGFSDYKSLAGRLSLTQSSIRDYVGRLIKKGIPVEKNKINNKAIRLSVSQSLKRIASLSTILQLREM